MRNPILGMASHGLRNAKATLLGATPGATDGNPMPNRPLSLRRGGEAGSRLGSGGSVPNKPLTNVGTSLAFYRGSKGPSLENSQKSLKRGSRSLLAPGPKKLEKEWKMTIFQVFSGFLTRFRLFFDFFRAFLTPGPRGLGTPFQTFFGVFKGGAFLTPVEGQRCPNTNERFSFAHAFSERFFKNWGGPRPPELSLIKLKASEHL